MFQWHTSALASLPAPAVSALVAAAALGAAIAYLFVSRRGREQELEHELRQWRRLEASLAQRTAALEHAVEGIGLLDAQGVLCEANRAMAAMYGRRPRELVRRPATEFLREFSHDAFEQALAAAFEAGKANVEVRAVRPDGSMFDAEVALVRLAGPEPMCHVFMRDISERKEAERANRLAFVRRLDMMRLEETDRFKTRFMNAAAHEINTPLTPLRLQLHMLADDGLGTLNERQAHAVRILERNLGRLSRLVGDMLDVTRLHSGRLSIDLRPLRLDQTVEHVVSTFRGLAEGEGVQVMATVPGAVTIQADRERLDQVLANLVSNAVKFTPHGGQVQVHLEVGEGQVRLRVRDTGLGMTPEQIDQLFQPFGRLHTDIAPRARGTGLGLYIAKGLVEGHGGRIACTSAGPGKGSCFEVMLPESPPGQEEASAPAAQAASNKAATTRPGPGPATRPRPTAATARPQRPTRADRPRHQVRPRG